MQHLFVPYQISILAKEKGFNESCLGWWDETNRLNYVYITNKHQQGTLAPLYQQLIDWFESKEIYINPYVSGASDPVWYDWEIYYKGGHKDSGEDMSYETRYQALDACFLEAFKLI